MASSALTRLLELWRRFVDAAITMLGDFDRLLVAMRKTTWHLAGFLLAAGWVVFAVNKLH